MNADERDRAKDHQERDLGASPGRPRHPLGKGNQERTVYLHPGAAAYVGRWLVLVNQRTGLMFRPVDRWGNIAPRHLSPRRLSPRAIGLVVDRRRRAAHLGPLSTHDWRRAFVGDLLDSGARLSAALVAVSPPADSGNRN